VTDIIL